MDVRDLFKQLNDELESEQHQKQSSAERSLHETAQRLLRLERDLKVPGACAGQDARIARLLAEISKAAI